jgi:hypothetical protein
MNERLPAGHRLPSPRQDHRGHALRPHLSGPRLASERLQVHLPACGLLLAKIPANKEGPAMGLLPFLVSMRDRIAAVGL